MCVREGDRGRERDGRQEKASLINCHLSIDLKEARDEECGYQNKVL